MFRQAKFRETKEILAYDVESLYGDIGGYMGLLLGYSILNFPTMILFFYKSIKKSINDRKSFVSGDEKDSKTDDHLAKTSDSAVIMIDTIIGDNVQERNKTLGSNVTKSFMTIKELHERLRCIEELLK